MYKLFLPSFILFVYDSRLAGQFWEICNLSLYVSVWVGLFVLLRDKKVMWICHLIKQIFHSSSKNRSDMALHILLAVVEYQLNIAHLHYTDLYGNIFQPYDKKVIGIQSV